MTDVPATAADTPMSSPPSRLDTLKGFIGDLARPFAIYAVALSTAKAIWHQAPADVIGAAGFVLAALYGAKAYETREAGRQQAQVQIAQATGQAPK